MRKLPVAEKAAGLDIDWEYPTSNEEAKNLVLLLEEVRTVCIEVAIANARMSPALIKRRLLTIMPPEPGATNCFLPLLLLQVSPTLPSTSRCHAHFLSTARRPRKVQSLAS